MFTKNDGEGFKRKTEIGGEMIEYYETAEFANVFAASHIFKGHEAGVVIVCIKNDVPLCDEF